MPWSIHKNHKDCPADKPWGVVKDTDGSLVGCSESKEMAMKHLAVLYSKTADEESQD